MRSRFMKVMQILVLGCCFQLAGCQSQQITDILATSFKDTAVEIGTFVIESILDNAFPTQ